MDDIRAGDYTIADDIKPISMPTRDILEEMYVEQLKPVCSCGHICGVCSDSKPEPSLESETEVHAEADFAPPPSLQEPVPVPDVPTSDVLLLDERATAIIRESLEQIKYLEGKVKGLIEMTCLGHPGQWSLNSTAEALVRTDES